MAVLRENPCGEGDSVRELAARVARLAPPGPPQLEALQETFDLFAPDGRPLRARIALAMHGEKPRQIS